MGFFDDLGSVATGVPIVGGFFDHSDDDALAQLQKNQGLYNFDLPTLKEYDPENFKYQGDYRPESAEYRQVAEDPMLRSAQMSALAKLSGLADNGLSQMDELGYHQAQQLGARDARQGTQAAINNANARGIGGSGLEFAMREMANQGGADRTQEAALQQAADSARQRAQYQMAYGDALSGARDQDYRTNAQNSNIINQFNQMNTQNRNSAQMRNLDSRQAIRNANVTQNNQAQLTNNDIRQQGYQNQMERANAQSGANTGMAQGYAAQNASRTSERNANTAAMASILGGAQKKSGGV
jgi:hypothetical protein